MPWDNETSNRIHPHRLSLTRIGYSSRRFERISSNRIIEQGRRTIQLQMQSWTRGKPQ